MLWTFPLYTFCRAVFVPLLCSNTQGLVVSGHDTLPWLLLTLLLFWCLRISAWGDFIFNCWFLSLSLLDCALHLGLSFLSGPLTYVACYWQTVYTQDGDKSSRDLCDFWYSRHSLPMLEAGLSRLFLLSVQQGMSTQVEC